MGLRFDPVGGGQFKEALKQIIEAERQPIKQIEKRKGVEEAKSKLFQEFKGKFANFDRALNDLATFKNFRDLKVELGDGTQFVDVTVDKNLAEPGTYQLEVSQLAKRSSIMSNGFSSPDEPVAGMGFVVMNMPDGDSKEIFVSGSDGSLRGIAMKINQDKDSPVQASVVNDQSDSKTPWKLIMTAKKDGLPNEIDFPEFYFMDGERDLYVSERNDADNALLKLDGFELEAGSNQIKEFLTGVNLNLKQARPDQPITIKIQEDYQKIAGKVKTMVEQVNGILEFINKQNQIDSKSDTRSTFAGDTSLQTIEYRLRNLLHEGFPVGDLNGDPDDLRFVFTHSMGVEFDKAGKVNFNEQKFQKALEDDFGGVSQAISGEWGMANQLKKVIGGYTRMPDGMIPMREQAIRTRIKRMDDDITAKEVRLERRTQNLTDQFSRLQSSLSNLQRQGQYVQAMGGGGGGGNMVSQLLGG